MNGCSTMFLNFSAKSRYRSIRNGIPQHSSCGYINSVYLLISWFFAPTVTLAPISPRIFQTVDWLIFAPRIPPPPFFSPPLSQIWFHLFIFSLRLSTLPPSFPFSTDLYRPTIDTLIQLAFFLFHFYSPSHLYKSNHGR